MKRIMERFVIVTPRAVSPAGTSPRIHPPLGAIATLAEAKRQGFDVALLDSAAEGLKKGINDSLYCPTETVNLDGINYWKTGLRHDEVVCELLKLNPDVIGLSCCTVVDRGELQSLSHAIKSAFPDKPIVAGGHEASHWYREILGDTAYPMESAPDVDYIVVGPGQSVIGKLLECFTDQSKLMPRGVAFRDGNSVVYTGDSLFEPNMYSPLDYSLLPHILIPGREKPFDVYSYIGNPHAGRINTLLGTDDKIVSYLPLLTSYGCGFSCTFCDTDKKLVRYNVEKVIEMIEQFRLLFGVDYIDFMDNNFGGGTNHSRDIAFAILDELGKSVYGAIGFSNGLTFESMMREDFRLLRKFADCGNVQHIAFPCENGNDRVLRMVRKPHTLKMVKETLAFASENLACTNREGFFIGGFPSTNGKKAESPSEMENTFHLIVECLDNQWLNQAIFLTLSPVTREYRQLWRSLYPEAPFEHCLFSRWTGVWPYSPLLLEKMHRRVEQMNLSLSREVTRQL